MSEADMVDVQTSVLRYMDTAFTRTVADTLELLLMELGKARAATAREERKVADVRRWKNS